MKLEHLDFITFCVGTWPIRCIGLLPGAMERYGQPIFLRTISFHAMMCSIRLVRNTLWRIFFKPFAKKEY